MADPTYLKYMKTSPELLREVHIQAVGEYFNRAGDKEHLLALMQGENAFFSGELETAVANAQKVYDSIPDSEKIAKEHAHLILIEVKRCQRHSARGF